MGILVAFLAFFVLSFASEIEVAVKKPIPLRDFLLLISGLSGKKIILLEGGEEKVWFVGKGSVYDVLDAVVYPAGYFWEERNGKIIVRKFVSGVWRLPFPRLNARLTFSGRRDPLGFVYTVDANFGKTLSEALSAVVVKGKYKVDTSSGIVTFSGPLREKLAVESVIRKMEEILKDRVKLKLIVAVLNDEYLRRTGIDLATLFRLGGRIALRVNSPEELPFSLFYDSGNLDFILSALERKGVLEILENREFESVSGIPIVFSQRRVKEYVKSTRIAFFTPVTGTGNQSVSAIPTLEIEKGEISEGSSLVLVPQRISGEKILLELGYSSSTLNELKTEIYQVQGQEQTLQNPDVSHSDFSVSVELPEGKGILLVSSAIDRRKALSEGVPYLHSIPFVGYLFGKKERIKGKVRLLVWVSYAGDSSPSLSEVKADEILGIER